MDPRAFTRLAIDHQDPDLVITFADDRQRTLTTDGATRELDSPFGIVETSAEWKKDGRLVIKMKNPDERRVTETWELSADGERLSVLTKIEGGRRPELSFERVYDAVESVPAG